jgi:hypothetical protein
MERRYKMIPSADVLTIDYNLLADDDISTTRYSVDGAWAIIEYKPGVALDVSTWTNDEACEYLEANYWQWNYDSLSNGQT